ENPDYVRAGLRTADSIEAAITYMKAQPFIGHAGIVVAGQSAGGWGALALASRNPRGVRAVLNFAGGPRRRSDHRPNNNCSPDRLVAAAAAFGRSARIPTLWLYSENDSYFAPALSDAMYRAFRSAGGPAEYHLLPPFGAEGHRLIELEDAAARWRPMVEAFLAASGNAARAADR